MASFVPVAVVFLAPVVFIAAEASLAVLAFPAAVAVVAFVAQALAIFELKAISVVHEVFLYIL